MHHSLANVFKPALPERQRSHPGLLYPVFAYPVVFDVLCACDVSDCGFESYVALAHCCQLGVVAAMFKRNPGTSDQPTLVKSTRPAANDAYWGASEDVDSEHAEPL